MTKTLLPPALNILGFLILSLSLASFAHATAWQQQAFEKSSPKNEALPPIPFSGNSPIPNYATPQNFAPVPKGRLTTPPKMRGSLIPEFKGDDPAFQAYEVGQYLTALSLAKKQIEKGEVNANTLVAKIYEQGLGVQRNFVLANQFYAKGAAGGDPHAKFALAMMAAQGLGQKQDKKLSADLFEALAKSGYDLAQYNYALILVEGVSRTQNLPEAAKWLEAAAKQDNTDAQYDLGMLYLGANGFAPNRVKAATWIGKAAQTGHVQAMTDYAVMLFNGRGVQKNEQIGFQYFKSAAIKGNPVAQNRLARLYAYGVATKRNMSEAAKWHFIARQGGLSDIRLDYLISQMPADTRTKAHKEAAIWLEQGH